MLVGGVGFEAVVKILGVGFDQFDRDVRSLPGPQAFGADQFGQAGDQVGGGDGLLAEVNGQIVEPDVGRERRGSLVFFQRSMRRPIDGLR